MAWLTGYKYRKQITIAGTADGAQANYQLKLTVYRSAGVDAPNVVYLGVDRCLSNYNDLRFTTSDETTLLDYWIESSDAASAVVWIEFDSIPISPGTATFFVYYNNAGAAAVSNGENTFPLLFDDFSVDLSKWTNNQGYGFTYQATGGELKCSGVATANMGFLFSYLSSLASITQDCVVVSRVKGVTLGVTGDTCAIGLLNNTSNYTEWRQWKWTDPANNALGGYYRVQAGIAAQGELDTTDLDLAYHQMEMRYIRGSGNTQLLRDGVSYGNIVNTGLQNVSVKVIIDKSVRLAGETSDGRWDWIYVRNFTTNEPVWSTWGAEENFILGGLSSCGCGR